MRLIQAHTQTNPATRQDGSYTNRVRETGIVLSLNELKTGGYYLFKEKFGMVALVKVIQNTSTHGWIGFRFKIKRILYSPWDIPVGTIFEKGYSPDTSAFPTSWHFEPCMLLIKTEKILLHRNCKSLDVESVL